jgi:hypothetical protein
MADMVHPEAMVQAGMDCSRVNMEGRSQLFDSSQLLDTGTKIDFLESFTEVNIFPKGIAYSYIIGSKKI